MDLILWLYRWKLYQLVQFSVSILVLVDLILWQISAWLKKIWEASFNPCFGGSYIVTDYTEKVFGEYSGFNPCFGGSYIVTTPSSFPSRQLPKFQSLFWWILYCDRCTRETVPAETVVSILVLVDLILWRIVICVRGPCDRCFNPCFGGSYIVTRQLCHSKIIQGGGSILVLVDLILWPWL